MKNFSEYKLINDPRFLGRIAIERENAKAGRVYTLDQVRKILNDDKRGISKVKRSTKSSVKKAPVLKPNAPQKKHNGR